MAQTRLNKAQPVWAFDFFCGAGGLSRGLLDAGISVVAGFDLDARCRQSYEANNRPSRFIEADMRQLTLADLRTLANGISFTNMLFAGCAPCQPFSQQVKNRASRHDGTLLGEFGRLVQAARPGYVLVENVPGIKTIKGNSTFKRFLRMLDDKGYKYVYDIIDAKKHGVPQKRRRLVLIAARQGQPCLPRAKHGVGPLPYPTVRDAIAHFPPLEAGQADENIPNHTAARITPLNIQRLRQTPHDGGDRRSWPQELRLECHTGNYEGHTDVYGRMAWDEPAPTLTGRCHSLSNGRYGHPSQDRAISLREAAALQSFPDRYIFYGSNKHIAQQIGNAVPVRLAENLGRQILEMHFGNESVTTWLTKYSGRPASE